MSIVLGYLYFNYSFNENCQGRKGGHFLWLANEPLLMYFAACLNIMRVMGVCCLHLSLALHSHAVNVTGKV